MQLLVEVDGEYWHRFESSKKNDAEKQRISENQRITLLRISSDDFRPELIFQSRAVQIQHTRSILLNRGIDGF